MLLGAVKQLFCSCITFRVS